LGVINKNQIHFAETQSLQITASTVVVLVVIIIIIIIILTELNHLLKINWINQQRDVRRIKILDRLEVEKE
jgi:uncharacterized membrane protein YcjF (UPF0283 family)